MAVTAAHFQLQYLDGFFSLKAEREKVFLGSKRGGGEYTVPEVRGYPGEELLKRGVVPDEVLNRKCLTRDTGSYLWIIIPKMTFRKVLAPMYRCKHWKRSIIRVHQTSDDRVASVQPSVQYVFSVNPSWRSIDLDVVSGSFRFAKYWFNVHLL